MATFTSASLSTPAIKRLEGFGLLAEIKSFWHEFFTKAFNSYRPELHYMRGPGPAWHAKYGTEAAFRLKPTLD